MFEGTYCDTDHGKSLVSVAGKVLAYSLTFGADSRSCPVLRPCVFGPVRNSSIFIANHFWASDKDRTLYHTATVYCN